MISTYNVGICQSGNRTEITERPPMTEHPSSTGKVSSSIPGSVTFPHYWFKNYSAFNFSVLNIQLVK